MEQQVPSVSEAPEGVSQRRKEIIIAYASKRKSIIERHTVMALKSGIAEILF